jgi:DNA polymerase V
MEQSGNFFLTSNVARRILHENQGVNMRAGGPISAVEARTGASVPLVIARVPAGFPSPADDYLDRPLDFNELLIENPDATFAVRIAGDSMIGAGIFPGDIGIVDRSKIPRDKSIIVAILDGEFTVKRYRERGGRRWLEAENTNYKDIELTEETNFEVWGCVKNSIRMLG